MAHFRALNWCLSHLEENLCHQPVSASKSACTQVSNSHFFTQMCSWHEIEPLGELLFAQSWFFSAVFCILFLCLCGLRRYCRDQGCQSVRQLCLMITHSNPGYFVDTRAEQDVQLFKLFSFIVYFLHTFFSWILEHLKKYVWQYIDSLPLGINNYFKRWITIRKFEITNKRP